MITYKIDKQAQADASKQIRDMEAVLNEIAPSLQLLAEAIARHEAAIASPSINNFRYDLQKMVNDAIVTTRSIAQNAQRLVSVSDQASKHLVAIEDHFGAVLRQPATTSASEVVSRV